MASKLKTPVTTAAEINDRLPKGWRMVRFGDVVRDVTEAERNPLDAGLERFVGLEHIEPENLHLKQWGNLADGDISFTKRFRKGQVLFGKRRAYQKKIAVAEFDGICSSDILTFEPKDDALIPDLLPFIVQSDGFFQHALGTSSGSLSPRTRWSQLQDYEFPLPPKDEQRRIAEVLWAVDDTIESAKIAIIDTNALCNIAIADVLEHGFVAIGNRSSELPDRWRTGTLGSQCDLSNGHGFGAKEWAQSGLPIIRIQNLNGSREFNYFDGHAEPEWIVEPGELLFAWAGVRGVSFGPCLWDGPRGVLNQHIYRIVPRGEVEKGWLYELLRHITHRIEKKAHGFKLELVHVRKSEITDQIVAIPPIDDQRRIVRFAETCRNATVHWQSRVEEHTQLKKRMLDELIRGNRHVQ